MEGGYLRFEFVLKSLRPLLVLSGDGESVGDGGLSSLSRRLSFGLGAMGEEEEAFELLDAPIERIDGLALLLPDEKLLVHQGQPTLVELLIAQTLLKGVNLAGGMREIMREVVRLRAPEHGAGAGRPLAYSARPQQRRVGSEGTSDGWKEGGRGESEGG